MKGPIRVCAQLFVTFVEAIRGQEKRFRIGHVNGHRHVESSGRFPHLIESLVVNLNQWAGGYVFAEIESERLENFQATRTSFFSGCDLFALKFRIVWHGDLCVPGFGENDEAIGMRSLP